MNIFVQLLIWPENRRRLKETEGAVKLFTAIWLDLFGTIINSAFYKSGPCSRRAERKAVMEVLSGLRAQGEIFCGVIKPFLNLSAMLQSTLFGKNQHHTNCEMWRQPHARRTNWAQKAKILRTAGSLKLLFHIKCVDSNKTLTKA